MPALEDFGPIFAGAGLLVAGYFVYRLRKLIRQSDPPTDYMPQDVFAQSLTARALNELSKSDPNFIPVLQIMERQVAMSPKRDTPAARRFLDECKGLTQSTKVDGATFGRMYYGYLDLVEVTR
jgi:hypothetical protein